MANWFAPVFAEVFPCWVCAVGQFSLLFSSPALKLLLPCDGGSGRGVSLEPDQSIALVGCGEAGGFTLLVLRHTAFDVAGDSDIQNTSAAGYDVGVVAAILHKARLVRAWIVVLISKVMVGAEGVAAISKQQVPFASLRAGSSTRFARSG